MRSAHRIAIHARTPVRSASGRAPVLLFLTGTPQAKFRQELCRPPTSPSAANLWESTDPVRDGVHAQILFRHEDLTKLFMTNPLTVTFCPEFARRLAGFCRTPFGPLGSRPDWSSDELWRLLQSRRFSRFRSDSRLSQYARRRPVSGREDRSGRFWFRLSSSIRRQFP